MIDASEELSRILSEQMAKEIDKDIISTLQKMTLEKSRKEKIEELFESEKNKSRNDQGNGGGFI